VSLRRALLVAFALLVAAPVTALAGSVNVLGKGTATYAARGAATAFSTRLLAGSRVVVTALPVATAPATVTVNCLNPRQRRCARFNARQNAWIISKPATLLVEGADFRLALRSPRPFQLGITGVGRLVLAGRGTYTTAGVDTPYLGRTIVKLRT